MAALAIESGKVEVAGDRTKPSRSVRPGDRIRILRGGLTWDVRVTGLSDRRGSARQAALLYSEGPESIAARTSEIERARSARAEAPPGRPTKRQRRRLEDFLSEP